MENLSLYQCCPVGGLMMKPEELIGRVFSPGSKVIMEFVDSKGSIRHYRTEIEDLEGLYLVLRVPLVDNKPLRLRES